MILILYAKNDTSLTYVYYNEKNLVNLNIFLYNIIHKIIEIVIQFHINHFLINFNKN
jgi:hypothetical protein